MEETGFRSGFAALIGRPNVGKSTLLNALVGHKVAITSHRPQTTRNRIRGVLNLENAQVVFIDTPGLHKPKHALGEMMVKAAESTLREVDAVLAVMDATEPDHPGDAHVLERLKAVDTPVMLLINKVDAVPKPSVLEIIAAYKDRLPFHAILPVSALDGTNLDALKAELVQVLPEGPRYYPEGMITDHPESFLIAEIIREKVLLLTREEVPHSVMVEVEQLVPRQEKNLVYVHAVIYTERESQKAILIGKGGQMLKQVGQLARQELEILLGTRLFLELWVKVKRDWRNHPGLLRQWGFEDRG
ncbi:GTPase Era [Alicyclobacillus cellulosilyticus]|uniref:GTPase Era n=1 Tax=Alicyclobacillus cellulosilyticus TaxID=1003997 RepID=A0A917KDG3_9BACL|nr:GTPase Era [Alicyclobacillus cellulosilyticus]GGJ09256.1 GTPase Era [Alicyclobacillus cellulosilyticus]